MKSLSPPRGREPVSIKKAYRPALPDGRVCIDIYEHFSHMTKIGSGSFSSVYKCREVKTEKIGCIKILDATRAFHCMDEEKILRKVQGHESVCRLLDAFMCFETHLPVLFLELLEDLPVKMLPCDMLKMLQQMCLALDHIWGSQFVHNDVKPANILRKPSHNVYVLTDFGSSFVASTSVVANDVSGDAYYLASDRFQGQALEDYHKIDVYALGVTAVEKLVGSGPDKWGMYSGFYSPAGAKEAALLMVAESTGREKLILEWMLKPQEERPLAFQLSDILG